MFEHKIPTFNPAPLRKEILETMRDLAVKEQSARYGAYSNGILAGCGLFERGMRVGVEEGIIKFAGRVYVLDQPESVPYQSTDAWTVLKVQFSGEKNTRDFQTFIGQIVLDANPNILPNEIELGRFKLKHGSRLRTNYTDFQDMETEYDTVNLVHVPYAGISEPTLSPIILIHFAREAYPFATDPLDLAFCSACLAGSGVMSRESIRLYLWRRSEIEGPMFDNRELHSHLANALAEMKGETRPGGQGQPDGVLLL